MANNIQYIFHEETDSTQLCIKRLLAKGADSYTVVSAGHQNAGRGRRGNVWQSPRGSSVSTSLLLLEQDFPKDRIEMITLVAAVSAAEAINTLSGLSCLIKWPNDCIINGKKVCGILTEIVPNGSHRAAIIGIGINVHKMNLPGEIRDIATTIDSELKRESRKISFSRQDLIEALWTRFKGYMDGDNRDFKKTYEKLLVNTGRAVRVSENGKDIIGNCIGVDENGALLVETSEEVLHINSGEVSVRGLYGYI